MEKLDILALAHGLGEITMATIERQLRVSTSRTRNLCVQLVGGGLLQRHFQRAPIPSRWLYSVTPAGRRALVDRRLEMLLLDGPEADVEEEAFV